MTSTLWRHAVAAFRPPPRETVPRRLIVLLAGALALESCDSGTVGATAALLHDRLGFSTAEIGLLASASALIGAAATVPMGILVDRLNRIRLLTAAVAVWALAMIAVGAASGFWWMLLARCALGVVTAVAAPVSASLIGDTVPQGQRGRVYSFLLSGELAGTGAGFLVSGEVGGLIGWRWAYWWLVIPSVLLAYSLRRLPEPARGQVHEDGSSRGRLATDAVRDAGIAPDERVVLHSDPAKFRLWQAVRYVFSVRTNVVLVIASVVGYYFFTGLKTFAVSYLHDQYGLAQTTVSLLFPILGVAAVVGVLVSGFVSDRLLRRGIVRARVLTVLVAYAGAIVLLAPAIAASTLAIGMPLLIVAAGFLGSVNPPLDAARIDIMPARLLGRAEAFRSFLRNGADSTAPAVFGFVSGAIGMRATFLVMLVPMILGWLLGLLALRTYPRDVATASASDEALSHRRAHM